MKALSIAFLAVCLLGCGAAKTPARPVATVNGEPIAAGDLAAVLPYSLDSGAAGDSIRSRSLADLIDKRLFIQEAVARGLDTELAYQTEQLLKAAVIQRLYDSVTAPGNRLGDDGIHTAHELLKTEIRTRLVSVHSESTARRIRAEIGPTVPFESLAARHSVHPSAVKGGDLGFTPLLYIEEPLRSAVRSLAPGAVSEPVFYDRTWQLVQRLESRPTDPPPPPLEGEFIKQFADRLKQQRRRELASEYLSRLRARLEFQDEGLAVLLKPLAQITEAEKELPVVIKDGRQYVKVARLLAVADRSPLDPGMRRYSIEREVEEDLMYEDGLAMKLDQLPDVQAGLARQRDNLLYETLYRREITDRLTVSDDEIADYHRQNRDRLVEADLERARAYIRNVLLAQKKQARFGTFVAELRARATISIDRPQLDAVTRDAPPAGTGKTTPRSRK